jgi:voltage-gated potassium channel
MPSGIPLMSSLHLRSIQSQERLDTLERITRVPMLALALLMVPVLVAPELFTLSDGEARIFDTLDVSIWALFALEFVARVTVAPHRGRYIGQHWLDVLVVILPVLRPLRLIRSARAVFALRILRVGAAWTDSLIILRHAFRRRGLGYVLVSALVLLLVGSVLITVLEHNAPNATVHSIWDGIWWATATVTTVGYGDMYPVTVPGKVLAVLLMLVGIGFFSAITAIVAATMVETVRTTEQNQLDEVLNRLAHLESILQGRNDNERS